MTRARAVLVLVCILLGVAAVAPAVDAQDPAPASTSTSPAPDVDIIPRPNSGVAPEDPGDRGGWMQTGVFVLIVVVVASGAGYLAVQSRRNRGRRGY